MTERYARIAAACTCGVGAVGVCAGVQAEVAPAAYQPPPAVVRATIAGFVDRPGEMERTGRLIVRPSTEADLAARGMSAALAETIALTAVERLAPHVIERIESMNLWVVQTPAGLTEDQFAAELLATGAYDLVQPDYLVWPVATTPNDPGYSQQWFHQRIDSAGAWQWSYGSRITVAIVDTGVDVNHPDLRPLLVPGYNAITSLPEQNGGEVTDVNGHGTACAGIACAIGNNGVGVAGVAWYARLMPVRVTNNPSGSAFTSDIIEGVEWAATRGARAISVSYVGVSAPVVEITGQFVRSRGALLVWAADNANINYGAYDPPSVIVTGGTDRNDQRVPSSSFGNMIDLVAPGIELLTTERGGGVGVRTGNSFTAPMVAGTIALILSVDPSLTPAAAEQLLTRGAEDLGAPGEDIFYGAGRLSAGRSLRLMRSLNNDGIGRPGTGFRFADNPGFVAQGVKTRFYRVDDVIQPPNPDALPPVAVRIDNQINLRQLRDDLDQLNLREGAAVIVDGYFRAPVAATYTLTLRVAGRAWLYIGDTLVLGPISSQGLPVDASTLAGLAAGDHRVRIALVTDGGSAFLQAFSSTSASPGELIPPTQLNWKPQTSDFNADGLVTVDDFFAFLTAFATNDPRADINADGTLDVADFMAFLLAYANLL